VREPLLDSFRQLGIKRLRARAKPVEGAPLATDVRTGISQRETGEPFFPADDEPCPEEAMAKNPTVAAIKPAILNPASSSSAITATFLPKTWFPYRSDNSSRY
jgi:hypothetical protein